MLEDKDNRQDSAEGGEEPKKRKRVRVGDVQGERPKTPYRSSDADRGMRQSEPRSDYGGGERRPYQSGGRDDNRGGYQPRSGGYQPREGGYQQRDSYQPREGGYQQRDNYQSRGGYQQRDGGSYQQRSGGYQQRDNNQPREGGYQQRDGYQPREGGYQQRDGGERRPYQGGGRDDNRGGYQQRSGGYQQRSGGGYQQRSGGYQQRDGGYQQRPRFDERPQENRPKRLVKPVKYKENVDPTTPIRLNKYLANAGVCSRREADAHITAGAVKVNGEIVNELGAKVTRADVVTFHDQVVEIESKVYVLLNKPKNCVTTSDDPQNRLTVMDLVKNACTERIYPVGRLDRNTTGVLLLTNDGDLASKLMHPKYKKKKIYQVTLDRDVTMEDMQAIADGIELDDGEIHADSIAYNSEDHLNVVGIEIHSGRNRIVRRIFEKLNYKVIRLDRVYFSGLTKKNIPRGKWRYLTATEVNMLRMGAFE